MVSLQSLLGSMVGLKSKADFADNFLDSVGITDPGQRNAFVHTFVSTSITAQSGKWIAKQVGDGREIFESTFPYYQEGHPDYRTDTFRDLYNNYVGRQIGEYSEKNNLGQEEIAGLVFRSLERGDLIYKINLKNPDPRIPKIVYEPYLTQKGLMDDAFNGWPDDFDQYMSRHGVKWSPPQCFLAGTPVLMADGTEKPIEDVQVGDSVMAFDPAADNGLGETVPKRVSRLYRNATDTIIDLRGLKVTPGHHVLSDNGEWMTIAEVLRLDRCIVEDRNGQPTLVRARTGMVKGTAEDTPILIEFSDPQTGRAQVIRVRAGIPSLYLANDDTWISIARYIAMNGMAITPDGNIIGDDEPSDCCDWPLGSTPFDHDFQRNFIVQDETGVAYVPDWIAELGEANEAHGQVINGSSTLRVISTSRPATGSGGMNRKERRKQSALRRVK